MRTLTLTLPDETVDELEARVASGDTPDLASAIAAAVAETRDDGLASWLQTEVAGRVDRLLAGEPTLTIDEARAAIEAGRRDGSFGSA